MYLIAGLGNPSEKYENTRHNVGFVLADKIAEGAGAKMDKAKFRALIGEGVLFDEKVVFAKPQTFMNLSGESIIMIANYYKIPPAHIIVIYDDVYINSGMVRVRMHGSSGGHNGMKNIIHCLKTELFPRVRVGVGPVPEGVDLYDHVLGKFSKEEIKIVEDMYDKVLEGIELIVSENKRADR